MSDRSNFYFKQQVSAAELNGEFTNLENSIRRLTSDVQFFGIFSGLNVVQTPPLGESTTVTVIGPGVGYDRQGRRIYLNNTTTQDISKDQFENSTVVSGSNERWVSVFCKFVYDESNQKVDGSGAFLNYTLTESVELFVKMSDPFSNEGQQGIITPAKDAVRTSEIPILSDEFCLCDILYNATTSGGGPVQDAIIFDDRFEIFRISTGNNIAITDTNLATVIGTNAQDCIDSIDDHLTDHFDGSGNYHNTKDIQADQTTFAWKNGQFVGSGTADSQINSMVEVLGGIVGGVAGSQRIATKQSTATFKDVSTVPAGDIQSSVESIVSQLGSGTLGSSKISSADTGTWANGGANKINAGSVQAQINQVVSDLASTALSKGSSHIGSNGVTAETPKTGIADLTSGLLYQQIKDLSGFINGRLSTAGGTVSGALTVTGQLNAQALVNSTNKIQIVNPTGTDVFTVDADYDQIVLKESGNAKWRINAKADSSLQFRDNSDLNSYLQIIKDAGIPSLDVSTGLDVFRFLKHLISTGYISGEYFRPTSSGGAAGQNGYYYKDNCISAWAVVNYNSSTNTFSYGGKFNISGTPTKNVNYVDLAIDNSLLLTGDNNGVLLSEQSSFYRTTATEAKYFLNGEVISNNIIRCWVEDNNLNTISFDTAFPSNDQRFTVAAIGA